MSCGRVNVADDPCHDFVAEIVQSIEGMGITEQRAQGYALEILQTVVRALVDQNDRIMSLLDGLPEQAKRISADAVLP